MSTHRHGQKHGRKLTVKHRGAKMAIISVILILGIGMGSAFLIIRKHNQDKANSIAATNIEEPLKVPPEVGKSPVVTSVPAATIPLTPRHGATIPPIENGLAPVISTIVTKEPVVFLGIDDGANKQSFELQMMKDNNVKATLFLANRFISNNPDFFKPFVAEGSLIEDHTIDHKLLPSLSYADQKQEICGEADLLLQQFGRRPVIFRPPGGSYNTDTQRAAAACGMKAVVNWIAKANGGSMQYQVGHSLRPGDIVLMHFRPEFKNDMQAFLKAQNAAGLHTELLEDWLPPS